MGLIVYSGLLPISSPNDGIFCIILSVPHNIVMDLNNVMVCAYKFGSLKMWNCVFVCVCVCVGSKMLVL